MAKHINTDPRWRWEVQRWSDYFIKRLKCWVVVTWRRGGFITKAFIPLSLHSSNLGRINMLTVKRRELIIPDTRCLLLSVDDVSVEAVWTFPDLADWWRVIDWLILMGWERLGCECQGSKKGIIGPTCQLALSVLDLICTWYATTRTGRGHSRGGSLKLAASPSHPIFTHVIF